MDTKKIENDYFVKLPNKLFYSTKEEEKTIIQHCDYDFKVLEILSYLYIKTDRKGIANFTLENLITANGYKPERKKGKTNDQFKVILEKLKELGIIVSELDFLTIKPTQFIECTLNLFETDGIGKEKRDIKFVCVDDIEKEKIYNTSEKVDKLKLFTYYCYLKCRMFKRKNIHDIQVQGGKAEICYPSYATITQDLCITDTIIKKYNDILVDLELIKIDNAGLYYHKNDKTKKNYESCNIYTLVKGDWTDYNLKEGIKEYKLKFGDKRVFINTRDYKNNDKQRNGYIARIGQLEKEGKATLEQLAKRDEYLEDDGQNVDEACGDRKSSGNNFDLITQKVPKQDNLTLPNQSDNIGDGNNFADQSNQKMPSGHNVDMATQSDNIGEQDNLNDQSNQYRLRDNLNSKPIAIVMNVNEPENASLTIEEDEFAFLNDEEIKKETIDIKAIKDLNQKVNNERISLTAREYADKLFG